MDGLMTVKKSRWLISLTAVALAASACGGGGGGGDKPKVFTFANIEPEHLIPGNTNDAYGLNVESALFDTLMTLDANGKPVPQEAASVDTSDQKVWTIKIKPGLTFHNGEPVTAQSYADAWNHTANGANGWGNNAYFSTIDGYADLNPDKGKPKVDTLKGLKVVDPQTLQVTLSQPFSQFPYILSFLGTAPMPKAAFTDLKAYEEKPIGNGPFEMDGSWEHNRQIKTKKFAGYKGPRPAKSGGVIFKTYASRDAAYTDLRAGRVDFDTQIPAAQVPQAKRLLGNRYLSVPSGTMDFLEFPLYDSRFGNPDLRKAISMAIDRQSIVNAVFNGIYKPTGSLLAPIVPGYRADACGEACTYNPTAAKQLFDKAGGFNGTLHLLFSNADPTYEQWMTDVANQLKQNLGIKDITFDKIQASDYISKLVDHKATGPYRSNWTMDYPSAEDYLTPRCSKPTRSGYDGAACEALIQKGNAASTPEEGQKYYQQAEDLVLKDLPLTPLWNWQDQAGYSSHVGDVHVDPYVQPLVHLDQVTVK
ncbi:ABC transporter substrate-binding protein [Actinoallomurus sp. NPDC052274]|uniref:peptide ABC transporter substrate-binding protein n=1 Tax=Actinoallomurus sp. NPDC052274 TaxID=3155420 RepID=UPI00343C7612